MIHQNVQKHQNAFIFASLVKSPNGTKFDFDYTFAQDQRSSQEVWSAMKKGMSLQKIFVKGFGSIAPTEERIAEIRFTELDPETKYEMYVIMSSEQPIEK